MKFALINPNWTFEGSVYFGCRNPHLPLELGYAAALINDSGHEARIFDAHLLDLSPTELKAGVDAYDPDFIVITTAPSYLFWRCAPPELTVPKATLSLLRRQGSLLVGVGPHCSATPGAALDKLGLDIAVMGECEEVLPLLAEGARSGWHNVGSIAYRRDGRLVRQGGCRETDLGELPALSWPDEVIHRHRHHHHRFDAQPVGPGVELEASRGCPFHCTFCAKEHFRDRYRVRPLRVVLEELDRFIRQGATYAYFVDEIFLPDQELLQSLAERPIKFGIQTRIDLWSPQALDLLGKAGCVSLEAGVESITEAGRRQLNKRCRLGDEEIVGLLFRAKETVPFVQANLLRIDLDDPAAIEAWRKRMIDGGVWANQPVPVFPYPGSDYYSALFGPIDDQAWERAHNHYLDAFSDFSDLQANNPLDLSTLESTAGH